MVTDTYTTSSTDWTVPGNVDSIDFDGWGAGGPGGARRSSVNGGSGASASRSRKTVSGLAGHTLRFIVAQSVAGGTAAVNAGTPLADGGASEVQDLTAGGAVIWRAGGGRRGVGGAFGNTGDGGAAGELGDSIGDTIDVGNPGQTNAAGPGGSAPGGGAGGASGNPGSAGTAPGGGGGAGTSGGTSADGGAGARGEIRATYVPSGNVTVAAVSMAATARLGNHLVYDGDNSLPSWAGSGRANQYNGLFNLYNYKLSNTTRLRQNLEAARLGTGLLEIVVIGDSAAIGYNGTTLDDDYAFPRAMAQKLAAALDITDYATGIAPGLMVNLAGFWNDRWAVTGPNSANSMLLSLVGSNATATYTPPIEEKGTIVDIFYRGDSAAFDYQIDGGSIVDVTPSGTANVIEKVTVTDLADTRHIVKIIAPSLGTVGIAGVCIRRATGLVVHNVSLGGSRAAGGTAAQSWTDTSSAFPSVYKTRKALLDLIGVDPDLVINFTGGNEHAQGVDLDVAIAGIATERTWYPSADFLMMGAWEVGGTNLTTWNTYWEKKYQLADTLDVPLLDLRDRYAEDNATADALGYTGADGDHPTATITINWGEDLKSIFIQDRAIPASVTVPAPMGAINAQMPAPTVVGQKNGLVVAPAMTASATVPAPVVIPVVTVQGAVQVAAAQMYAPIVHITQSPTIEVPVMTAAAFMTAPQAGGEGNAGVTVLETMSATAESVVPFLVHGQQQPTVLHSTFTAAAETPIPVVEGNAVVVTTPMTVTTTSVVPTVKGTANVAALSMVVLTAEFVPPVVLAEGDAIVHAPMMEATAFILAPLVSPMLGLVTAPCMIATASMQVQSVGGTPPKSRATINYAQAIYLGNDVVSKIMVGAEQVWP